MAYIHLNLIVQYIIISMQNVWIQACGATVESTVQMFATMTWSVLENNVVEL